MAGKVFSSEATVAVTESQQSLKLCFHSGTDRQTHVSEGVVTTRGTAFPGMHLGCYIRNPKNNRSDGRLNTSSEPVRGLNLPGAESIFCFPSNKVFLPVSRYPG